MAVAGNERNYITSSVSYGEERYKQHDAENCVNKELHSL
jgi:hypothetical protein